MVTPAVTARGVPGFDRATIGARLRRSQRAEILRSLGLIAPLLLFLGITFLAPIGAYLFRSVANPEVPSILPRTVAALGDWDGIGIPEEPAFAALYADLKQGAEALTIAMVARRLNYDITGFRTMILKTGNNLPAEVPGSYKDTLIGMDPRWGENPYWAAIKQQSGPLTSFYLLAALDRRVAADGSIERVDPERATYIQVFGRTFWISAWTTIFCLLLGYPVAYGLATAPPRIGNLLMICVLIPFWTSLLVRTSAWVILLQEKGPVNGVLQWLGLLSEPLTLIFNRFGVYVAMTQILLPFMILPLYSVMRRISPVHMRAATSLGADAFTAFRRVYLPQTLPGVAAGTLLVFILALGYYITPAMVGGAGDQMISYFVALYTNQTINWGLAAALGTWLLACTLLLYALYNRFVGIDRMRLG